MQSIYSFLDITKVADFWLRNADVSRIHGVSHVIYIYANLHHHRIYVTDFKKAYLSAPPPSKKPILNMVKDMVKFFYRNSGHFGFTSRY